MMRGLFYVALTRARKEVVITYPRENSEGKELLPSQFLDEISSEHKEISIIENKINTKKNSKEKQLLKIKKLVINNICKIYF